MTTDPDLINTLTRLGFSQYEAQAYIALVGKGALTGAEVGRGAGMPPSKIYETLARLESKGAVLVNRSEPVRYSAVPHADLLAVMQSRFEADVCAAKEKLDSLPAQEEPGLVWSLRSRQAIVQAFARVAAGAKRSIFAGIWDEEMDEIGPLIEQAAARGVDAHVAIYGKRTLVGPRTYDLSECGASARLRLSGRRLAVVVADDSETVVAEFGDRTPDQAVLTTNPVTCLLAVEYIKADVGGRLLINAMPASDYQQLLATPDMRAILAPAVNQAV
ncbi:TrmB family transcriptional regulator [Oryzibacter oryziterrae]|uniref:TrmB family transcriptional regulator n=1 Tax=Oryzibacter oryziterrae TaxID=2766474 RepID=UPI001F1C8F53|nr:helix-turn-helix domain-containing protein [Oryzibacter oryziterrae]